MAFKSDVPPHGSAQPFDPPTPSDDPRPNVAMLKGDIESGRTGDKNPVFDPGLSPLGTDHEASGTRRPRPSRSSSPGPRRRSGAGTWGRASPATRMTRMTGARCLSFPG